MAMAGSWKLITAALKAKRAWDRLPPEQRKRLLEQAGKQAKEHGPTVAKAVRDQAPVVAKRVQDAVRNARKPPPPAG
jgi:acyl-CoA reductase-like NAD-dependent aldehyde dehydrogenase